MAYNKARAEKQWLKWKEAEERKLRELGVDEDTIQRLHTYDWAQFNIAQGGDSDFYAAKLRQLSEQKMGLTNQLQEIQKKKMADQAQEYQYQQALLYINNEENLNLTEFNDDFIRRIIEQVTVLSATQIRIRFVGGYEQDANLPLKK